MRPIAIGCVLGMFATAQVGGFGFLWGEGEWSKGRSLMATIAKGLFLRLAARAPEIGLACLDRHGEGGFLGDVGDV